MKRKLNFFRTSFALRNDLDYSDNVVYYAIAFDNAGSKTHVSDFIEHRTCEPKATLVVRQDEISVLLFVRSTEPCSRSLVLSNACRAVIRVSIGNSDGTISL